MNFHILLLVQNNSFPSDKRVAKEAISLKKAGYKVSVISPAFGKDQLRRELWNGIDVCRYSHYESHGGLPGFVLEYGNALLRIFLLALRLWFQKRFKIIHIANPPDFFWPMALFFKLFKVKFIFDQHDISPEMYRVNERKDKNFIYRFLLFNEKLSVLFADAIITTNYSILNRSESFCALNYKPREVVYNGPSSDFNAKFNYDLQAKYKGRRVILYVGEMAGVDCVEVIISAAEKIVREHSRNKCIFVLLGDGPDRDRLEELSKYKDLTQYVEFTGMVDHITVMHYLDLAEVCLVPDEPNGLNEFLTLIKSLEYMKAARPFVAFNLKETLYIAGESALFANNLQEYVHHILYLLDHPEEANAMGIKGKQKIEDGFLWEHQVPQLLKIYRQVLG